MHENGQYGHFYYTYDDKGNLTKIRRVSSATIDYYVTTNIQGDVEAIYDANGNLQCRYIYDAWGKTKFVVDGNGNEVSGNNIGYINSIRYRGYYLDRETGLYYLQSRYYDPDTTRFINADDINYLNADILGTNLYIYCMNNPVNDSDPSGHLSIITVANFVTSFAFYLLSWYLLSYISPSRVLTIVSSVASLIYIVLGIRSYLKDINKQKNKYQKKLITMSLVLCIISNGINFVSSLLGFSKKIIKKFGNLISFVSVAYGLGFSIVSLIFDIVISVRGLTYAQAKKRAIRIV